MLKYDMKNLKGDLYGGIIAGVIALPLALAFGEASGAGPIAGLWGAIIVGFLAAAFGGTNTQITGPTGPMVVVFAGLYASLNGNPELVFTSVFLGGLMMIAFGVFKLGNYIRLVPYPVISGFMSGIGGIIIALQVSRLFGHEPAEAGTIPALTSIPSAVMDPNLVATALGAITLGILFFYPKSLSRFIPTPLVALIVGTVLSLFFTGAPILGDIPTGFPDFVMPTIDMGNAFIIVEAAFLLAVLGSIDSLLTSLVADNMTSTKHKSNKELFGQGLGNAVAGLFGAIPGAGATMRTVINIRSGGVSRLSGMVHALLLLGVVLALSPLAAKIPHTVLAAILIKVGYDIIDWNYLKMAHRGPRFDLALMALVLVMTIFVDLITAVAVGVVLASLAFVKQMADLQLESLAQTPESLSSDKERKLFAKIRSRTTLYAFSGPLSFGAAAELSHRMRSNMSKNGLIIIDFSTVPFLDLSAAKAIEDIIRDAVTSKQDLYLAGANDAVKKGLKAVLDDAHYEKGCQWFPSRLKALEAATKSGKYEEAEE
ncbi:MAG: sodium-independent anion transporter [Magnetococcales bacterium]|nr:sodium-independent anion transporter [Magnetococcales bacterium]|tara:strand:+ start:353661 stop:355283 length:1623 start_codon:yes stop_codon:yes gene_type:complete